MEMIIFYLQCNSTFSLREKPTSKKNP